MLLTLGLGASLVASAEEIPSKQIEAKFIENLGQPIVFESANSIDDVVVKIENFYNYGNTVGDISIMAALGTKWAESQTVYDGQGGHYLTTNFWVKGSNTVSWNIVGNAQRKAVVARYGSVNSNTSYKMKTTQHIVPASYQTHGYMTLSAVASVYDRDPK